MTPRHGSALTSEERQRELLRKLRDELGPGVDAKLERGGEEGVTDQTLRRWLTARKWNFAAAQRDFAAHADWRENYVPGGRVLEEQVHENLAEEKAFVQGFDNQGHPVLVSSACRHHPKTAESIQRFICYTLDAMVALGRLNPTWDGKAVGIIYLRGMTMANGDTMAGRAMFDMLQNHFPERLYKMYLYDAPFIFYALWKIVSPFVDPVTRKKVCFVYPGDAHAKEMLSCIPKEILPSELGGTGAWRRVEDAWKLLLQGSVEPFLSPGQLLQLQQDQKQQQKQKQQQQEQQQDQQEEGTYGDATASEPLASLSPKLGTPARQQQEGFFDSAAQIDALHQEQPLVACT